MKPEFQVLGRRSLDEAGAGQQAAQRRACRFRQREVAAQTPRRKARRRDELDGAEVDGGIRIEREAHVPILLEALGEGRLYRCGVSNCEIGIKPNSQVLAWHVPHNLLGTDRS